MLTADGQCNQFDKYTILKIGYTILKPAVKTSSYQPFDTPRPLKNTQYLNTQYLHTQYLEIWKIKKLTFN